MAKEKLPAIVAICILILFPIAVVVCIATLHIASYWNALGIVGSGLAMIVYKKLNDRLTRK